MIRSRRCAHVDNIEFRPVLPSGRGAAAKSREDNLAQAGPAQPGHADARSCFAVPVPGRAGADRPVSRSCPRCVCYTRFGMWTAERQRRTRRRAARAIPRVGIHGGMINRHFDPYNILVDPGSRTVLLLNPKVLTQFTRWLVREGMYHYYGMRDLSEGRYRFLRVSHRWPFKPPAVYADLILRPGRYSAYTFVRNPYARIASAWRSKLSDPHNEILAGQRQAYPPSMRKRELARIRRFAARRGLPGAQPQSLVPFEVFVEYLASQRGGHRDPHWDLQSAVVQLQHFDFAGVFRIEDALVTGFETVFARFGFEQDWLHRKLAKRVNASSTPAQPLYSPELAHRVYQLYRPDFTAFGYEPDSWRDLDTPAHSAGAAPPACGKRG